MEDVCVGKSADDWGAHFARRGPSVGGRTRVSSSSTPTTSAADKNQPFTDNDCRSTTTRTESGSRIAGADSHQLRHHDHVCWRLQSDIGLTASPIRLPGTRADREQGQIARADEHQLRHQDHNVCWRLRGFCHFPLRVSSGDQVDSESDTVAWC